MKVVKMDNLLLVMRMVLPLQIRSSSYIGGMISIIVS